MPIFRSRHQAELLSQLFTHPDEEYSLSELSRLIDVPLTTLQREAQRLVSAGLILDREQGRNRLLTANTATPVALPLTQLLNLTFGPIPVIAEEFGGLAGVQDVVIFGSWAARYAGVDGHAPNDIDVLVIGHVAQFDAYAAADRAQARLGLAVNPTMCTPERWNSPGDDALVAEIHRQPHTTVYHYAGSQA